MLPISVGGRPRWLQQADRLTSWHGRIPLFVGVAGHRQLAAGEQGDIERQLRTFFAELRAQLPATPVVVTSRLAAGADQLAASAALATGCELACLLPVDVATYRAAFELESARIAFDRLFAASEVVELEAGSTPAADPGKCYAQAGYYLARYATLLLVLWDGLESHRRGSVCDVVHARSGGWMGEVDPTLCTLHVGRRDPAPGGTTALSARAAIAACGWREADAFNAAISAVAQAELARAPAPFEQVPDKRVGEVAAVLRAASMRAAEIRIALARRKTLLQCIAFLAAIAFAVFLKFGTRGWALWVYLALLAGALSLRVVMRRQGLHRRYLDCRCLAEGLRVAVYWRIAGVLTDPNGTSRGAHSRGGPDASLGWVGLAITALDSWMGRRPLPATFDGCEFAARHWLGSEASRDEHAQIPYYRATASRMRRIAGRVERVVSFTLITGVASAALLAVVPAAWLGRVGPALIAIMGFMPLISGTASAAIDVPTEMEVVRQYDYMGRLLTRAARRLAAAESDAERRQVLFEAGAAALAEQRIWHAVVGQKGPEGHARA